MNQHVATPRSCHYGGRIRVLNGELDASKPFILGSSRTAGVLGGGYAETLPEIEGLAEEQCRLLQSAQVGDLLLVQKSPLPTEDRTYEQRPSWEDGGADWGGIPEGGVEYDGGEGIRPQSVRLDSADEASVVAIWGYRDLDELARSMIPSPAPTVEDNEEVPASETASNDEAGERPTEDAAQKLSVEVGDPDPQLVSVDDERAGQISDQLVHGNISEGRRDGDGEGEQLVDPTEALQGVAPNNAQSDGIVVHASDSADALDRSGHNGTLELEIETENEEHESERNDATPGLLEFQPLIVTAELDEYRFNRHGYDRQGYDADGYDQEGYNRNGYDRNGYDRDGLDMDGYGYDGYDRDDCDRHGNIRYDSDDDESSYGLSHQPQSDLYIVVGKLEIEDGAIADIFLRCLDYQEPRGWETPNTYRLYGDKIEVQTDAATHSDMADVVSLTELVRTDSPVEGRISINPDGGVVRSTLRQAGSFHHRCNAGFLYSLGHLQDLYPDTPADLNCSRPLCPVCVGTELVDEQLELRRLVDSGELESAGPATQHVDRRNAALGQLGFVDPEYDRHGFDEKEWGFDWEGMRAGVEEGQNADEYGDDIPWHLLPPEARDPNHDILARPASADAIAALPRRLFGGIVYQEDDRHCRICSSELSEETVMIELPCGHFFCECLTQWLEHQHSCPNCRTVIPGAGSDARRADEEGGAGDTEVDEGAANVDVHADEQLGGEDGTDEGNGVDGWVQAGGSAQPQHGGPSTAETINAVGWTSGESSTVLDQSENALGEAVPESDW